jgi:hypothetical protein
VAPRLGAGTTRVWTSLAEIIQSLSSSSSVCPITGIPENRESCGCAKIVGAHCHRFSSMPKWSVVRYGKVMSGAVAVAGTAFWSSVAAPQEVRLEQYRPPKTEEFRDFNRLYLSGVKSGLTRISSLPFVFRALLLSPMNRQMTYCSDGQRNTNPRPPAPASSIPTP